MLKFVKHHMETIIGIEIYPLISLLIFFIFFTGLIYLTARSSKHFIAEMSNMPLEDEGDDRLKMPN